MGKQVILRIITVVVIMVMLPVSWALYNVWKDWYTKPIELTPEEKVAKATQTVSDAARKCMVAEVAEGAADPDDMVLIAKATVLQKELGRDPCAIFLKYTLMRAPSEESAWAYIRDPDVVVGKQKARTAWATRIANAYAIVDRALKGDFSFQESGEKPEVREQRKRILGCREIKYIRVWPWNTARTNVKAMEKETDPSPRFASPSGTRFFCLSR